MISPDYLESAFKESEKFSFELQGYGSFAAACKRLVYINFTDVLGFIYLCETPCSAGSKEYQAMLEFFNLVNLSGCNKKFLIVSRSGLNDLIPVFKRYDGIRFAVLSSVEFVTDRIFDRDIFGSILLDNYEPYVMSKEQPVSLGEYACPSFNCESVIPGTLFDVEQKVYTLENVKDTLENDIVLQTYEGNNIIQALRKIVILRTMGESVTECVAELRKLIEKLDTKRYGIYTAFLDFILEGDS